MTDEDWWAQAVDQFGLKPLPESVDIVGVDDDAAPADEPSSETAPKRKRRRPPGLEWVIVGVIAIGVALLLRAFVVQQFAVDGESMLGSLHSGDRVLVNKLSYRFHDPRRGDVVVLEDIKGSVEVRDLIKRVVAVPGDTIEYRDCKLFLDGELKAEPYLDPALVREGHCGEAQPPVVVEPDHVFVMGDNRSSSLDSRTPVIGQIPFDHLIGRAFVVLWPFADLGWL